MATKVMKYVDDLGEVHGVNVDDTLINALKVDGGTFDDGDGSEPQTLWLYADEAAFVAANSGKAMLPDTISARTFQIKHPFGIRTLISPAQFDGARMALMCAQDDFGDDILTVDVLTGESRSNAGIVAAET